jgi:hypothetical protein
MKESANSNSRAILVFVLYAVVVLLLPTTGCKRLRTSSDASPSPLVQPPTGPVASFESFVRRASERTNEATPVRRIEYTGKWDKCRFNITDLKMDVRKTESLVNPILGLVSFSLHLEASTEYATEAEVRTAQRFVHRLQCDYEFNLRYAYNSGHWALLDGTQTGGMIKQGSLTVTPDKIRQEPDAIPYNALKDWLTDAASQTE